MTKHTPGPWVLDDNLNYVRAEIYRGRKCLEGDDGSETFPAICHVKEWPKERWDFMNKDEARANARLIAAAPDLLTALKMALDAHTLNTKDYEEKHYPLAGPQNLIDALRKAIDKAEEREL